jgi:CRP/FNR family transcriptional regulator
MFRTLTGSHLLKLDKAQSAHEYRRGQIIFYEGNPPLAVHCIYSGSVKLYKTGRGDKKIAIRLLGRGKLMGYRAVLANEPYAATAEAVETAKICTIPRDTFEELLRDDLEFAHLIMEELAHELRISEDQMVSRMHESVRQRTARFLVWVLDGLGGQGEKSNRIVVPILREEMAQMIGTTPETLSRVLKELATEKVIVVDRKRITVVKQRALRRLAVE